MDEFIGVDNKGVKLAGELADYVNYNSRDRYKDFIEGFTRQHRTLQQSSFRMILKLIEFMTTDDYRTDLRNEDSKEMAKSLLKGFQMVYIEELKAKGLTVQSYDENVKPSHFLSYI
jgi:hypothetical protein